MYDQMQKYICSLSEWFLKDGSNIYDLGVQQEKQLKIFLKNFLIKK